MTQEGTGGGRRHSLRDERGQVVVLFALLLPMLMAMGSIVIALGGWFVHAKHLQTKVDAAAFAGGAVWGFPCGADVDANIEDEARKYVGDHTAADGAVVTGSYNPQLSGVGADQIFVALNQAQWWSGSFAASDFSDPGGGVCESKVLDVKATEADASLFWRWLPLFPDIKRKARVEVQEVEGLTGLLPIAVRLPQPLSAAAVFYDEETGNILDARLFRQVCLDPDDLSDCTFGAPPGLGQWTTAPDPGDPEGTWASFPVATATGVAVATSVRPACGAGTPPAGPPCMNVTGWAGEPIDDFCRQASGTVRCFDADGLGSSQTVNSGLHFIRGYSQGDVGGGPPEVRGSWLETFPGGCPANGYFNSSDACQVKLTVVVDIGSKMEDPPGDPAELVQTRTADHVEVRYCLVRTGQVGPEVCDPDLGSTQFGVDQDLEACSGGPGEVTCSTVFDTDPQIVATSRESAFAIQVRLRRTSVDGVPECDNDPDSDYHPNCRWFFTGTYVDRNVPPTGQQVLDAPIQRSFMGDIERTTPIKWLRLTVDDNCDPGDGWTFEPDVPSQPVDSTPCWLVDLGTAGGLARDQDEPPIAFNLGDNSSQRAYVDCDPNITNLKSEIETGCQWPSYAANKFATTPYCPDSGAFFTVPKPEPFDTWPPFRCVITQTGNPSLGQITHGFNLRMFGTEASPKCPTDEPSYVKGRNYWHRHNNMYKDDTFAWDGGGSGAPDDPDGDPKGNTLPEGDPRLVTLFFTTYDSFTGTGNEVYPIVGFGNFYVTGYGEVNAGVWKGGGPEDPCDKGNGLSMGAGNEPPPDIDMSRNTGWVWGHFVKDVTPAPFTTGGSGVLCNPEGSFQPCVAVLVE